MAKIPKAYDQAFKSLSDVDPRGLFDIFGVLPHGMDAEVESLPREISARPLVIDTVYIVRPSRGKAIIAIFEALTSWKKQIGSRLAAYGAGLCDKYRMPIRVYVFPMARHACLALLPEHGRADWGDCAGIGSIVVDQALGDRWAGSAEHNSPRLNPWAVLFRLSKVQKGEGINRVKESA